MTALRFIVVLPALFAWCATARSQPLDYARDIHPILQQHCAKCHGTDKDRGGLRLHTRDLVLTGGDSGAAIVPGKSGDSLLIQRVTHRDKNERMPKDAPSLSDAQIARLKRWIDEGATGPTSKADDGKKSHWAFQPVKRPTLPAIENKAWTRNPIDAFILARLEAATLAPSKEADRATLMRRLKFDLLGLPPTPEEVDAFVKDADPLAYDKLVERYLASPHYGERWARHWLDAVRFAESDGFETNQPRANAWPYRDYVIRTFNEDKPYDRFILEQLAGDQLGVDVATGFLVGGAHDKVKSPDINLTLMQRGDELHDMVNTTGATFLGLTVGCARCHNHKFDPISHHDYYAMRAVFAGVQHGERAIQQTNDPAKAERAKALRSELAEVERALLAAEPIADPNAKTPRRAAVSALRNIERFTPVQAKFVRFTVLATNNIEPCIDELEIFTTDKEPRNVARAAKLTSSGDYPNSPIHKLEHINDGKYGNSRSWISNTSGKGWVQLELGQAETIERIEWARDREGKYKDRLATRYRIEVALEPGAWHIVASSDDRAPMGAKPSAGPLAKLLAQRADLERDLRALEPTATAYVGRFGTPEPTHRLHRGDPMQKRETVAPAALREYSGKLTLPMNATDPERRLALAKWIADPQHPLTARVLVNRLWQHHFGNGIVNTPSDFGLNGGKPSHPALLDWLASEFTAPPNAWSMKRMHRLIVLSATYRQASVANAGGLAKDAGTRLLWRYPPRRLEAEPLRDAYLFVSGKLDLRMGGPGFDLFEPNTNYVKVYNPKQVFGPAEWRRMIYSSKWRMQLDDVFGSFDCPDAGQIAPKRNVSTTPLQALNLMNSRFVLQQAKCFAERIEREAKGDTAQVQRAFRLAFQREPSANEQAGALRLVREHGLNALCRALFNANEFMFVD
jgi:mono/diheme cytochrome c family protein